ncbi:MAG: hypothetical protein JWM27_4762 [Gemmatimonadetes bacterium]|nr:hypothetical protein [Gemmatimonadota bacterium]
MRLWNWFRRGTAGGAVEVAWVGQERGMGCAVACPGWHAVVMLHDGTVLDPLSPYARTLRDYPRVMQMVGLWRVD